MQFLSNTGKADETREMLGATICIIKIYMMNAKTILIYIFQH